MRNNGINVMSLFDGISCGMIACERAGIKVNKYYSSEIDCNAIKVSQYHYPNIEQIGDVTKVDFAKYKDIDLLIGGSPCQNLSCMGDRKGLQGEKSKLFFEYVRALKELKPQYFLLENNYSMPAANKNIISEYLNVQPLMINSIAFSAQNRKRLYWTNIPIMPIHEKQLTLANIVEPLSSKEKYIVTKQVYKYVLSGEYIGRKIEKTVRANIRELNQPSKCLGTGCGDIGNNTGVIIKYNKDYYKITPIEAERLQTLPDNYTINIPERKRYMVIGNGWTVDVIAHILNGLPNEFKKGI